MYFRAKREKHQEAFAVNFAVIQEISVIFCGNFENAKKGMRTRGARQLEAVTTHKRRTREARRRGHFYVLLN